MDVICENEAFILLPPFVILVLLTVVLLFSIEQISVKAFFDYRRLAAFVRRRPVLVGLLILLHIALGLAIDLSPRAFHANCRGGVPVSETEAPSLSSVSSSDPRMTALG
ncbi:MAG: hypothetical protein AAF321_09795 [Pseudomonadota bacterium]